MNLLCVTSKVFLLEEASFTYIAMVWFYLVMDSLNMRDKLASGSEFLLTLHTLKLFCFVFLMHKVDMLLQPRIIWECFWTFFASMPQIDHVDI